MRISNILLLLIVSFSLFAQSEKAGFSLGEIKSNPQDSERICYSDGVDTLSGWKIHTTDVIDGYGFVIVDLSGNEVIGAFEVDGKYCEGSPTCYESQEWTYGIDNTGTIYDWPNATYEMELSDGTVLTWTQTTASSGGWSSQLTEWSNSIQASADAAGLFWFVQPRFIDNFNPSNIDGTINGPGGSPSGLPGAPSSILAQQLYNEGMFWRYINIQICPGQPVPTIARVVSHDDSPRLGGAYDNNGRSGYVLVGTSSIKGPINRFKVCQKCAEGGDTWYIEDGTNNFRLALDAELPNCYEPCGTLSLSDAPPDKACDFVWDIGCDNNNSTDSNDFTNQISRRATVCNGEQIALDYYQEDPLDPTALIDYTLVGSFVDCDSGIEPDLPTPECERFEITELFTTENITGTLRNREWDLGDDVPLSYTIEQFRTIRENFDFSLATTIDADWNNLSLNDTNSSNDVQDAQIVEGFISVSEPTLVRWSSTSYGYFALEIGECCGSQELVVENRLGGTNGTITDTYTFPNGRHSIRMWNIDDYANTSRTMQVSTDGGTTWVNANLPSTIQISRSKPVEKCEKVKVCEDTGAIIGVISDLAIDPSEYYDCSIECQGDSGGGTTIDFPTYISTRIATCIGGLPKYVVDWTDGTRTIEDPLDGEDDWCSCEDDTSATYQTQFKSSGIQQIVTDCGTWNGVHDFTGLVAGQNASNDPLMAAAEADINTWLSANGGGTVTLEYLSQSILTITISNSTCVAQTANDDSNPGPHNFNQI